MSKAPLITQVLSEEHTASFAYLWMEDLAVTAMPVARDGEVVGVALAEDAKRPDAGTVGEIMKPLGEPVSSAEDIREAAAEFTRSGRSYAPVEKSGRIFGIVTPQQLIEELSSSWDPLTSLPWSDRLRDWGADTLGSGTEITILFFDLDDFGIYNKKHGHIVGDRVLKAFVEKIEEHVDPETDVFVRYGGDEFVIGSTRTFQQAEDLLYKLQELEVSLPDLDEQVGFSVGMSGGKRTKERLSVHFAATLDNLINLASQDCLKRKKARKAVEAFDKEVKPSAPQEPPLSSVGEVYGAVENALHRDAPDLCLVDALYTLDTEGGRNITVFAESPVTGQRVQASHPMGESVDQALVEELLAAHQKEA